ncbi:MAG: protein kinase [Acidobacteriota bacterium]|nr:protein kinase [Acidobacteriota bacterium]
MTPERWQQIEQVFQTALDLSAGEEREIYLKEACADDAELRGEVEKLLTLHERAGDFISIGAIESGELPEMTEEVDNLIGKRIGAYRLVREIGRGGMGAVYEAERADNSFQRRVAVKFIKRGMDTDLILKRFRNERQILASLNHPNIARLLDGGTTKDGLPYFVMEFIEGEPLYRYCDTRKLGVKERLELFRQICDAVEEAHRNKVVHRDLKPSNILVKPDGTAKLLDFGIAKLLDPELAGATIEQTATQMRLMTPEYASPEQVCGEPVTPAADVYSLGVLLYELLTGHRPYRFRNRAMHEISRVVCEQEPLAPSECLTRRDNLVSTAETGDHKVTVEEIIAARNANLETLRRDLMGNLDRVILKALRKEPAGRYQTAGELSEEITRVLEKRPVKAQSFAFSVEPDAAQKTEKNSIAILPFKMFSGSETGELVEEFLGIGLTDALISRLLNVRRLTVRPTSSVLRFAETTDSFSAGRELGVEFVLEGNIRRAKNRIRLTVQLLDIESNSTLWAQNFDEDLTDVLALEDSISTKVAESLVPRLTGEEQRQLQKRGTNSPAAYEAFLRGRFYANHFKEDSMLRSLEAYREAVRLDPDYALARVGIADFYVWSTVFGAFPPHEGYPKAKAELQQALKVDPALAEAYTMQAFVALLYDWDWADAARLVKKALKLNPNYHVAHDAYAHILASQGIVDSAVREIKLAESLDPLSSRAKVMTSCILFQTRNFDEAAGSAEKALDIEPNSAPAMVHLGAALTYNGENAKAVEALSRCSTVWATSAIPKYILCFALVRGGQRDEARKVLDEILQLADTQNAKPYFVAMAFAALGENDRAFEWFEKAIEARDDWMIWFGTDTRLDALRKDQRYFRILRKTNNPIIEHQSPFTSSKATADKSEKSIAVLPFKLLSVGGTGDADDEYLGIGLADSLVLRLSKVQRFIVRPTSSVVGFQKIGQDPFAIGRELDVGYVVEGTIRHAGSRIRVSVQLLDVEQNATRWAESFDEDFTDVLSLEDSISEKVAKSLIPRLTGEEQKKISERGTNNPQAYEAYLRGRFYWNQFTPEALPKALASFQTAATLDPEYALAHVGLADFYIWANIYGLIPSLQALDQAEAHARRAIELDERLGEAYASLGLIMQNRRRWVEAEKLQRQAIKLNPHYVHSHEWYAAQLIGLGRTEEGVEEMLRAESLDPLSLRTKTLTAWTMLQARRFDEALERGRQIVELDKNYPQGYSQIGLALWGMGRAEEALENFRILDRLMPGSALVKYELCFGLVAANRHEEALQVFEEIKAFAAKNYLKPYFLGMAYTAIGDRDRAFECFEKSLAEYDPWVLWLGTDPMLESLHDDERFVSLLERMDNPIAEKYRAKLRQKPKTGGGSQTREKSIAVLPLKIWGGRVTGSADDDYLGVGLADALTTRLSNLRKFVVRPTSSVLKYGGEGGDAFAAGRELEVDFVLDGTVRHAGNRIRVTAQLLNVGENSTAWAERFDENAADVLELEDSISEKVARSLIPHLTGIETKQLQKRGTNNAEAYEAFIRGRFYWSLQTEDGFSRAIKLFERAVELDPDYALAYSAIAEYYIFLAIHCVLPFAEATRRAKKAALKAVELDPDSAEAYNALGTIVINQDFDWKGGENYMRRAIETNPNIVSSRRWYNALLLQSGRLDEAMEQARKVIELDPDSVLSLHFTAWTHYHARRYDKSLEVHRQMLANEPYYAWGYLTQSWVLRCAGKFDEAIASARKALELAAKNPMYHAALAAAQAAAGDKRAARATLAGIEKLSSANYVSPFMQATVYCALGDADRTLSLLERAFDERDVWVVWIGIDPQFDLIRNDARYFDLLRQMNHPLAPAPGTTARTEKQIQKIKSGNDTKSVAVLPLKFIGSPKPEDAYLGIGLADAMITRLSQVGRLVVRPTSAVLPFAEMTDSFAAGRKLDVDFVLDGTIRRAGARVRITGQLLDVKSNSTRWAESFDENLTDVLDLEDRVAEKVARLLVPRLSGEEKQKLAKRKTDNAEAYETYLRGRYHLSLFTPDNFAQAKSYFEEALRLDPNYALAYIGLAECYFCLGTFAADSPLECYRLSREMAEKALVLDAALGEAYTILGFVKFSQEYDFKAADELLRRGIELNPGNPMGKVWYSVSLTAQQKFEQAIAEARSAVELNPMSTFARLHHAWLLYHTRHFDEAVARSGKTTETDSYFSHGRGIHSWILRHLNRLEESIVHAEAAVELSNANPWLVGNLAASYAKAGQRERALEVLRGVETASEERYVSPYVMAIAYYFLGETDKVFAGLEKAYAARDVWLIWLGVEPQLDPLREDSRFQDLLRRINSPTAK